MAETIPSVPSSLNPFMPSRFFYFNSLDKYISYIRIVWIVLPLSCFIEISELNSNSVDPDQTPRSVASDLVYTV